jgi:hypothetical protein
LNPKNLWEFKDCTQLDLILCLDQGNTAFPKHFCSRSSGTRQVFWLTDQPTGHPFPAGFNPASGIDGFRPRLQRRDRDGFAPSSLLYPKGADT